MSESASKCLLIMSADLLSSAHTLVSHILVYSFLVQCAVSDLPLKTYNYKILCPTGVQHCQGLLQKILHVAVSPHREGHKGITEMQGNEVT